MKRRRKRLMVIVPVAAVCVAGAGTVGYFKVAYTKPAQKTAAKRPGLTARPPANQKSRESPCFFFGNPLADFFRLRFPLRTKMF